MNLSAYNMSLSFGGTYFGGPDHNLIVMGRDDPGWAGLKRTFHDVPQRDGGEMDGGYLKPMQWTVPCRIQALSEEACRAQLESVLFALYTDEDQQLIFDSRKDVFFMASCSEPAGARWDAGQCCLFIDLVFQLSDPTGYAVTETEKTFTIDSNPKTISILGGDLELGSVPPWAQWIVETDAECTGWTIENATTGQTYVDSLGFAAGNFCKLDSQLQEKFYSSDGVGFARNNSGGSGTIPRLKPRVNNSITLTGFTAATLTVKYRERFAAVVR